MNDRRGAPPQPGPETVVIETGQMMEVKARIPVILDPQQFIPTDVMPMEDLYRPLPEPTPIDPSAGISPHR